MNLKLKFWIFRFPYFPKNNYIKTNFVQNFRKCFINTTRNISSKKKPPDGKLMKRSLLCNFTTITVLTGGTSLVISKNLVLCKPKTTRMAGYRSFSDKSMEFDWNQFWSYLKPNLKYFICAILVNNLHNAFSSTLQSIYREL